MADDRVFDAVGQLLAQPERRHPQHFVHHPREGEIKTWMREHLAECDAESGRPDLSYLCEMAADHFDLYEIDELPSLPTNDIPIGETEVTYEYPPWMYSIAEDVWDEKDAVMTTVSWMD